MEAITAPKIVGIVNITEDSFSDGGLYLSENAAIKQAQELIESGADVIDLGAASSHPDAKQVSVREEIKRLAPVVETLSAAGVSLSIDSFKSEVQNYFAKQASFLNDIHGFAHADNFQHIANANCKLVVMHYIQQSGIATREETDENEVLDGIYRFFESQVHKLTNLGIERSRLILDPGMGFFLGSTPQPSVRVLQELKRLKDEFRLPTYVSVSRKSFLQKISGLSADKCNSATTAAELYASSQNVDYIRTHDVEALVSALKVWQKLIN